MALLMKLDAAAVAADQVDWACDLDEACGCLWGRKWRVRGILRTQAGQMEPRDVVGIEVELRKEAGRWNEADMPWQCYGSFRNECRALSAPIRSIMSEQKQV